jgi:hypothetical protein
MCRTPPERSEEHERIPPEAGDYFVIQARDSSWFFVSTVMARAIDRKLKRFFQPRWITFVDLSGGRIRLRTDDIMSIVQSTPNSASQTARSERFGVRRRRRMAEETRQFVAAGGGKHMWPWRRKG